MPHTPNIPHSDPRVHGHPDLVILMKKIYFATYKTKTQTYNPGHTIFRNIRCGKVKVFLWGYINRLLC